jgi:hypothetical protein
MNRPISSTNTVTINRDQAPDQDALNELTVFKRGLGRNDRVQVNSLGNTTIYTQHKESLSEKFIRKLDNFEKNVRSAWSHVSDLFSVKNQGNESGATKNVKGTPTQKSPSSISVKQFNLEIAPITNTCIIPVLDDLTYETRSALNNLRTMTDKIESLDYALDLLASNPQDLEKVRTEFSAFLDFAEAQGQGKYVTQDNRGAIEFANRWAAIPPTEYKEMKERFGESYPTIFNAALALANFDLLNPFQKS